MSHRRRALIAVCCLVALLPLVPSTGDGAGAAPRPQAPIGVVGQSATPSSPASRTNPVAELVSISQYGPLTAAFADRVDHVTRVLNLPSVRGRSFAIGLNRVTRGDTVIQQASGPSGLWQYPMSVTVLPVDAMGRAMSFAVSSAVAAGSIVMGATSASLRGAQAGDVVDLVDVRGGIRSFVIGYVATDVEVGGAELVMSPEQADVLGATVVTRILIFGQFSHDQIDAQLAADGLIDGEGVRINRSWDLRSPDSTLGTARTKQLLGEFDFRVNSDVSLSLDAAWVSTNIIRVNYQSIGLHASCHQAIINDIQAALTEVAAAGLSFAIDLANTNTYGGCWNPRYARVSGTTGAVSRHAWGMALDMNTVANAQGRAPRMDCRVVRIFRKHNFAWGGNFLVPDGMHFEWVGEPRNTIQYPSRYCPNVASGGIESASGPDTSTSGAERTMRAVMFAQDGWALDTDHP